MDLQRVESPVESPSVRPGRAPVSARRPRRTASPREVAAIAAIFRTLSDPTRLQLLLALADAQACVHELCALVTMSQPAISHQLRVLRLAGLVRARRVGREVYYAIDDAHVIELVQQARSHAGHAASTADGRRKPGLAPSALRSGGGRP